MNDFIREILDQSQAIIKKYPGLPIEIRNFIEFLVRTLYKNEKEETKK